MENAHGREAEAGGSVSRFVVLDIPAPLIGVVKPAVKWMSSNDRPHPMAKAKLTAAWRAAGLQAVIAERRRRTADWDDVLLTFGGHVRVQAHVWKPVKNRYDPGNFYPTAKAVLDGIVESGLLVDDDWKHVAGPDMRHGGIGPARLVMTIEEENN